MADHSVTSKYFSGQGVVMLATRDVSGNAEGFVPVGNVSGLTLGISTTDFEHKESQTGARGVDLVITQEIGLTLSMVMESIDAANMALAMQGTASDVPSGTGVALTITAAKLGKIHDLGFLSVSNVVIQDDGDLITYVEGDNYILNEATGSIRIMTAAEQTTAGAVASIAEDDELHVVFDNAAAKQLDALNAVKPERWLRFEGLNTADNNEPVVVDIFKGQIQPLAELALINEELSQMTVDVKALADLTKVSGSKYYRIRSLA